MADVQSLFGSEFNHRAENEPSKQATQYGLMQIPTDGWTVARSFRSMLLACILVGLIGWIATPLTAQDETSQDGQEETPEIAVADQENAEPTEVEPHESRGEDFMRIRMDDDGDPTALETSITRYKMMNEAGQEVIVDLIGVVHIGEAEYYEHLNTHFEQYDSLLYELVAPEGTRIPAGGGPRETGFNPVSALQNMMKDVLELEFQLEHIDYNRENFVHADMTPQEFAESMRNNEESIARIFFRMLGQAMAQQGTTQGPSDIELLMAYFSSDRAIRLRSIMAQQMQSMDMAMTVFEGDDGSTIITHRNTKALTVMDRELEQGKQRLGIFYGAGHLPDFEERLVNDYGMTIVEKSWLVAWPLQKGVEFSASDPEPVDSADGADDDSPSELQLDESDSDDGSDSSGDDQS